MNNSRKLYIIEYYSPYSRKYDQEYYLSFRAASARMNDLLSRQEPGYSGYGERVSDVVISTVDAFE